MKPAILVVNAGSSSHKLKMFSADPLEKDPLWEGVLDWSVDQGKVDMHAQTDHLAPYDVLLDESTPNPLKTLLDTIQFPYNLIAIGHRVVHGGTIFNAPVRITPDVKESIRALFPLAPLHNPANLAGIEAMEAQFPGIPQFAVFDTAFHTTIPTYAAQYPVPQTWTNMGIRRYGFHGISHCYCAHRAAEMLNRNIADLNIIICHLGNGCSLTAVKGGVSIDTTMGFTPLEGLMMGTRSGNIDPSIALYLIREKGLSVDAIDHALNFESGLKAISDNDGDMRHIIEGISLDDADATLAFEMFIYRLAYHIGGMASVLGKVDVLVFTAGIGENSPLVRDEACKRVAYLSLGTDPQKNQSCQGDEEISAEATNVKVLVIHTQEEWAVAKECLEMLQTSSQKSV